MVRIPSGREPTHPGEMLLREFLEPLGLTQRELTSAMRLPYQRVNESRARNPRSHARHRLASL